MLDSNPTKTQDDAMTALYDTFVPVAIDFFTATASYSKNNIAQVFVYNRVLGSGERTKVYNYTRNELVKAGVL